MAGGRAGSDARTENEAPEMEDALPEPTYRGWESKISLPGPKTGLPAMKMGCRR